MKQVWKYQFSVQDHHSFRMPIGAQVLSVDVQQGAPCIWALVDPKADVEERHFRLAGTGHPINEVGLHFVGTFQLLGGSLIFHLFEVKL